MPLFDIRITTIFQFRFQNDHKTILLTFYQFIENHQARVFEFFLKIAHNLIEFKGLMCLQTIVNFQTEKDLK